MPNTIETTQPRTSASEPPLVIEGESRIRESYADYLSDESRYGPAGCDRLVFPNDEAQVAETVADAVGRGREVTVSAGRTGIVGGAVPRCGTLVSLGAMNRIVGISRLEEGRFVLRVEPGVTIAELRDRLEKRDLGLDPDRLQDEEREALEAFIADDRGFFYPPDPTEDSAHIGATVATNASGARSFRYGATRKHVHGLRVCLASGEVLAVERGSCRSEDGRFVVRTALGDTEVVVPTYEMPATKNAAGYFAAPSIDLVDLFVGSEGTLGIVTEVTLVLAPRPEGVLVALAFFGSDEDALAFVRHVRGDGEERPPSAISPLALEFFDSRSFDFLRERKSELGAASDIPELPGEACAGVLFEQEYTENDLLDAYEAWEAALVAHGSSMEQTWGGMEEDELAKLRHLRHSVAEEVNNAIARAKAECPEIHKISTDAAVPADSLEAMFAFYRAALEDTGLRYVVFGHVGDSHLHLNIMPRDLPELARARELARRFAEKAVGLGGTVSAEHGIGRLKHEFLRIMYGEEGLRQMAAVKRSLDPSGLLNRGVMFPEELLDDRSRVDA